MKKSDYTKETLLDVLSSYHRMIERSGEEYPTVVLGDIKKSIESVLRVNEYGQIEIEYPMDFENGYKIQTVFANKTEDGNFGDIYDFPSDVSLNHPGAEILTGYCVIAEASGLVAEGCNEWNETIATAIKDYEEHVILSLEQEDNIEIIAYQKYKKDWLQQRNYKEDIFDEIKTGYELECKEHGKTQSFEQYFEEYGIYGEIYCCFDEFLDNEYQDEEYMKELLTAAEYEKYLNNKLPEFRYEISYGGREAMENLAKYGLRAFNPKTRKNQVVDKNAKYWVRIDKFFKNSVTGKDDAFCTLLSNVDLLKVIKEKGLVSNLVGNARVVSNPLPQQIQSGKNKLLIYRSNDQDRAAYEESIKYWSNSVGELHHHGKQDITEEQLPSELKRAYNELWSDEYGCYCYLVETPKGYGIALINEYDKWFSDDCGLSDEELFKSAIKDALIIADDSAFSKADIYLGESMGIDRCHELAIIFPADISKEEFDLATARLETLVYQSAKTQGTEFTIINGISIDLKDYIEDKSLIKQLIQDKSFQDAVSLRFEKEFSLADEEVSGEEILKMVVSEEIANRIEHNKPSLSTQIEAASIRSAVHTSENERTSQQSINL